MKASVLGLLGATAAFGGSSIYLWSQLQNERERAGGLAALSAARNACIAQLESARSGLELRRFAGANTFVEVGMGGPGKPPASEAGAVANDTDRSQMSPWTVGSPLERSEAIQKMMRAQMRAHNKHLYADMGATLGLSKDQANKLIDLLTDQQSGEFEPFSDGKEAADYQNAWAEKHRKLQAEITELLGDDRVAALQEYQKSLPARQELEMLSHHLEGYDVPINDDQRKRLMNAMIEERDRVPEPDYIDGADMDEFQKVRTAWEEDYNERVASQARSILNIEQINAYTEYQQAQKDMRAHLFGGVVGGNVTFTSAASAGGVALSVDFVNIAAPPEADQKKQAPKPGGR